MTGSALTTTVTTILMNDDLRSRRSALVELFKRSPMPVLDTIISLLDSPDETLRRRAGSALGRFRKHIKLKTETLSRHLWHNADSRVRLSCAIVMMSSPAPSVTLAFRNALADESEKVAQIACMELAERGGGENTAALFRTLSHAVWRVRLEACKGLITQGKADQRVVATLEAMQREPEAVIHDSEIDEIERIMQEVTNESGKSSLYPCWGKLPAILQQARSQANK